MIYSLNDQFWDKLNVLSHDGYIRFIENDTLPAKNALDVLEIIKHKLKPKEHVLEDFDSIDEDAKHLLTQ